METRLLRACPDKFWEHVIQTADGKSAFASAMSAEDASLAATSWNAIVSAATRLNCDALALARALEGGGIADMVEAMRGLDDSLPMHTTSLAVTKLRRALALLPPAQAEGMA